MTTCAHPGCNAKVVKHTRCGRHRDPYPSPPLTEDQRVRYNERRKERARKSRVAVLAGREIL